MSCRADLLVCVSPQEGKTALHKAAGIQFNDDVVVMLLASKADVNVVDEVRREDACVCV